jgi:hypothetical protein
MSQNVYPAVTAYQDGADHKVQASELNKPVNQLRQRTDYLYDRLEILSDSGTLESVRLKAVLLDQGTDTKPSLNEAVYLDPNTLKFKKALATAEIVAGDPYAVIATSAYSFGLLVEISGDQTTGTVAIYGKAAVDDVDSLVDNFTTFSPGPMFLSASQAGKMTRTPEDLVVYMGFVVRTNPSDSADRNGYIMLAPQYRDMWEAHVHKRLPLASQPLGRVVTSDDPVLIDSTQIVRGFLPDSGNVSAPLLMHVFGEYDGTDPMDITITLSNSATAHDALITWSGTDGTALTTGIKIGFLERLIPIGRGLSVAFERNVDYSTYNSASFDPAIPLSPANDRTWKFTVPDRIKGWRSHWVRQTAVQQDATTRDYRIVLFGQYVNVGAIVAETFTIAGVSGNFASGTGVVTITDSAGNTATVSSIGYSSAGAKLISLPAWTGLWLMVSQYDEEGTAAAAGTVANTNSWKVSFTDEAPGAKFEYSMDTDKNVGTYFPPVPETELMLEMNGVMIDQRDMFQAGVGAYKPGKNTVYWYNDTYGYTPYPSSWVESPLPHYEDYLARNCLIYFNLHRVPPHGMVRSLEVVGADNPISLVDCNGNPAKTGDILIEFDLNLNKRAETPAELAVADGTAAVGVEGTSLIMGPVVRSLVQGPGITLGSLGQGRYQVSASNTDIAGEFDNITLYNAKQEILPAGTFSYIRLLPYVTGGSNIPNSFMMQMRVPYSLGTGTYRLCFYLSMFGTVTTVAAVNAGMKLTYNLLEDYSVGGVIVPESAQFNLLTDVVSAYKTNDLPLANGYEAYDVMVLHNDDSMVNVPNQSFMFMNGAEAWKVPNSPLLLRAGNLLSLKVERTDISAGTEYLGASLGFIAFKWVLKAATT